MYFQILKLILWSKKPEHSPRILEFKNGVVNVISGKSRTGKSAIIPIIDYCLASDKCSIPVKAIRDNCAWFGIIVDTKEGTKLFARREPGLQQSTGDMFILEGSDLEIPSSLPEKNATADDIKLILNRLAGLTSLSFSTEEGNVGFKSRPSFRDLVAFNFQPQNVIANPDVMFYKADSYEHKEKLQVIFPFVLGALSADVLIKRHDLAQLQKDLRRKERELTSANEISLRWVSEIDAKLAQAAEYGLVGPLQTETLSLDAKLTHVRDIVEESRTEVRSSLATIHESVKQLDELEATESKVSEMLLGLKRRYSELVRLRNSSHQFESALVLQRDRLSISRFISSKTSLGENCVICGSTSNDSGKTVKRLLSALEELEESINEVHDSPAIVDEEILKVRRRLRDLTESMDYIQTKRKELYKTNKTAHSRHYSALSVSRFIGSLEESINLYDKLGTDSQLQQDVVSLRKAVEDLRREIDESKIRAKETRALDRVSNFAGKLLPKLDCERPNDPIELSIQDLNVRVKGLDRTDYLWEIGSGSNWLSYHLAVILALHQLFLEIKNSPVPSLLIIDQPSQVYFPSISSTAAAEKADEDFDFTDDDVTAVRKCYSVLSEVVTASNSKLQIIVVDHAASEVWGNMPNLTEVEEWRNGLALVPSDWLSK